MGKIAEFFGFKKKPQEETRSATGLQFQTLPPGSTNFNASQAMTLPVVYRCIQCISEAVAQLPIQVFHIDDDGNRELAVNHPAYWLLNKEPSKHMTRHAMFAAIVSAMHLKGNAYIYIKRDFNGNAEALEFLCPGDVTIIDNDERHIMAYAHPRYGWIEPSDMVHIVNFSHDGEHGVSTLRYAEQALDLAHKSEEHARTFFESGASLNGIVTVNHVLTQKQKDEFIESWRRKMNSGSNVALLESDMDFKAVGVNPEDAQLLETRKYSVVDICRFFGVSPQKAYDLGSQSYKSIEASQLAFLTDTLQPLLEKIELEFERKLFLPGEKFRYDVHFDTSGLLRTDKAALAEYYTKMFNIGVVTTNEIRKQLDYEPVEKGDQPFIQSNLVPIDKPLNADGNMSSQSPAK